MKVLLTSAGLETNGIKNHFIKMVNKELSQVQALFIPTAAVNPGAIQVLPKCLEDLLKCGIAEKNITVYDLHNCMSYEETEQYDVIYICGGSTEYLLNRINEQGFRHILLRYIESNRVVVGVSAGSIIFANNLSDNLGLLDSKLNVHCEKGETACELANPLKTEISLTDQQALAVYGENEILLID